MTANLERFSDGATMAGAALQAAIDEGGVVDVPRGVYLVDRPLKAVSGLTLRAYGATFKTAFAAVYEPTLGIHGVRAVYVDGLAVDGNKAAFPAVTEYKHGIAVRSSEDVTIEGCRLKACKGDGLYFGRDAGKPHNVGAYVKEVFCDENHRQGITVTDLRDGVFDGCAGIGTGGTAPEAGLDVEPNHDDDVIADLTFLDCDFSENAGAGVSVLLSAAPIHTQAGIRFVDCLAADNGGSGLDLYRVTGLTWRNGDVLRNGGGGVWFSHDARNVRLVGGAVAENALRGVSAVMSDGATLRGLTVRGVEVVDNGRAEPGKHDGVRIAGLGSGKVVGAAVEYCRIGNTDGANQRYGVATEASASRVRLAHNDLRGNAAAGALLFDDEATRYVAGNLGAVR